MKDNSRIIRHGYDRRIRHDGFMGDEKWRENIMITGPGTIPATIRDRSFIIKINRIR